ncbi:MAG TPA: aminotransferase class III-fold pyridoxal phosphate-dependent enzyme [Bryobacteraceae bacterium]|nr:aminotransferase class III-fold pyridoxal phosphate-dependent enzyme [Bryobacteraceae bacterium]
MPLAATSPAETSAKSYQEHVNPQWVRLLNVLQMNVRYTRCTGAELFTEDGRRVIDFLSGYCVHNTGHNHPAIIAALHEELDRSGPAMLQSHVCDLAGELAAKLCSRAGGRLDKAFFCSSGSEGVEAAIKFSRAHTGRAGIVYASGAFHGLTCGALSLMDDPFWREGFGPLLPDTRAVPFGDLAALESELATKRFAAFIVEPIQAEAGIRVPPDGYFEAARDLCRKYGTLLVLDEVQTGMYRTGRFLASHRFQADPDMVILAKALSGGLVPSGAVLMTNDIYRSVYGSLKRAIVHTSTFSENGLSMRAGLATLDVLESERLGERAGALGHYLRDRLRTALAGFEMVKEVRGVGLLNGIEFTKPHSLKLRLPFETFHQIHPGMFGQVLVMRLFRDAEFLTQICGNHFMVLKAAPPLVVSEQHIDEFVRHLAALVERMHTSASFWTEALGMARRVIDI